VLRGYRGLTDDFPTEEEGKSYEQVMSLLKPKHSQIEPSIPHRPNFWNCRKLKPNVLIFRP